MNNFPLTNLMCKYINKKPTLLYLNDELNKLKKWLNTVNMSIDGTIIQKLDDIVLLVENLQSDIVLITDELESKLNTDTLDLYDKVSNIDSACKEVKSDFIIFKKRYEAQSNKFLYAYETSQNLKHQIGAFQELPEASEDTPIIVFKYDDKGQCECYCKGIKAEKALRREDIVYILYSQDFEDIIRVIPENTAYLVIDAGVALICVDENDEMITSITEETIELRSVELFRDILAQLSLATGNIYMEQIDVYTYNKVF